MGDRGKTSSSRAKKRKATWRRNLMKDQISQLPNEIIVQILSLLTMKEVGQTSVLSKRWRYIWAYIPVLNFDALSTLHKIDLEEKSLIEEKPRYLKWVNQVVRSYKASTIDEFRVQFSLRVSSRYSIDDWIKFAMEKRVKRLELDFSPYGYCRVKKFYSFRNLLMCNSLTSLRLRCVNVTGQVLRSILKKCPGLEHLSVECSEKLVNLEIGHADALNLKHFEVYYCFEIKHFEISAPNLVSFKYSGPKINTCYKEIPKVANLSIGGEYNEYFINNLSDATSSLFQLEALTLKFAGGLELYNIRDVQFPPCTSVKQLELAVDPAYDEDLFCFAPLIKACPLLNKFVLNFSWDKPRVEREELEVEACPHFGLKILEIVGFIGNVIELEFIMYLTKSCVALEKIIVDPREQYLIGTPWEFKVDEGNTTGREKAEQLRSKLSPLIDLIIL